MAQRSLWSRLRLKTLDRYVLGRFLSIYVANLFSFTLIFILIDAISHLDDFGKKADDAWDFLWICASYYAAITPLMYCQVLGPVVSVSASLFAVTTLQRTNELTPILATGRSHQRMFVPILGASFVISLGVFLIQEKWIPNTVSAIRAAAETRGGSGRAKHVVFSDRDHGLLIVFREYDRFLRRAIGVDVIPVARRGTRHSVIRARAAQWRAPEMATGDSLSGYWLLEDGSVQEYDAEGHIIRKMPPPEQPGGEPQLFDSFAEKPLSTSMIPGDIEHERDEGVYMTLGDLRRKAETSPDQSGWFVKYFSRFAYPLTNFVLVLLGIPVIVHFGNRNILFGALIAMAISTSYFVANSVFQHLGVEGYLPVRVGASLAPILFTAAGATLYREMRS